MAARAKKLSESEQLRFWLDGELATHGLTTDQLEAWRPVETAVPSKAKRTAAVDATVSPWPGCERYAYRGAGSTGRCWVCTPSEGEERCQWCQDDAWHRHNDEIVSWHHAREEHAREAAQPYHVSLHSLLSNFRGSETLRTLDELLEECGTPEAAIAWIRSHPIYFEDFKDLIPHLMAWKVPSAEVESRMPEFWRAAEVSP